MFICRIWDAANDILVGNLVDHTRNKNGKARPWLKWFALPCVISFIIMFTAPESASVTVKVIWVAIGYFAFAFFYTTVNLPYGSLMPLMTKDPVDRAALSGIRMFGAMIGLLVVSAAALPLVSFIGEKLGTRTYGYSAVAIIFGILVLICIYIVYANCHETSETEGADVEKAEEKSKGETSGVPLLTGVKALFTNREWLLVFLLTSLNYIRVPLTTSTLVYYFLYYFKMDETNSALFSTVSVLCGLILIPVTATFIKKFDYKKTLIVTFVLAGLSAIGGFLAGTNMMLALVFYSLYTMFTMVPTVAVVSMLADTIEYGEYKNGFRQDGLGFAANSFASKAMPAIGSMIMTVIFALAGLDTTQGIGEAQLDSAIFSLRFSEFLLPAIITFIQAALVCFYRLSSSKMKKINEELEKKHADDSYAIEKIEL